MSMQYRTLFGFMVLSLAMVPAFAQEVNTKKTETKTPVVTKEEPRADGLRKLTTRKSSDWDFDIHIDEEALEANIERAVEKAMRDVEVAIEKLEKLEIHIEPIEINLGKLNLDMKPIDIRIPNLNIEVEPIIIDLEDLDIDIDIDDDIDVDVDEDDLLPNKNKNKEEWKNKSENKERHDSDKTKQNEKDKAKGLKKMN